MSSARKCPDCYGLIDDVQPHLHSEDLDEKFWRTWTSAFQKRERSAVVVVDDSTGG